MPVSSKNKIKVERINFRVNPEQKELLERAASLKGLSLSTYILSYCLEAAKAELAEQQKLLLTDRDRDLFLSLMTNPPQPKKALVEAMREFQQNHEI